MNPNQLENREHVSRAFRFSAINQVVNRIATFGSGVIIMRILSPADVGTFAAATAFVIICTAFNDVAVGPAVIQWEGRIAQAARTGATIAISGSIFLYGIFYFLAPSIADWLKDDDLTNALRLLMLLVVIDGFGTIPIALLTRKMRQKAILYIETVSLIAQIAVTVVLANAGYGAFSLVWGMIASNGLSTLLMHIFAHEAGLPGFHLKTAKKLISFGFVIAASNIFRVGTQYFDNIVVGATQGTKQLGYYQLGYNGGNLPENTVGATVSRVSFAWFSEIKDNAEQRKKAFHDLTLGLAAATLPFVTLLSVLSNDIVSTLYGDKWLPAANIVRILAILGGIRVFVNFFADILAANGKAILELRLFAIWFAALVPALIAGSLLGNITGVALAHVSVGAIIILPTILTNVAKNDFPVIATLKHSSIFLLAAVAQGATSYSISRMVDSPLLSLVLAGGAGGIVFVLITFQNLNAIRKMFTQPDHGFIQLDPDKTTRV